MPSYMLQQVCLLPHHAGGFSRGGPSELASSRLLASPCMLLVMFMTIPCKVCTGVRSKEGLG